MPLGRGRRPPPTPSRGEESFIASMGSLPSGRYCWVLLLSPANPWLPSARSGRMAAMGYNLHLACLTCRERGYVFRNQEIESIYLWAKRHGSGHVCEAAIDNGVAERPWLDEEGWSEVGLPDDVTGVVS